MFSEIGKYLLDFAAKFTFDNVVWLTWGSYGAIFVLSFVLCLALPAVRFSSKKPFLCLSYCYTAATFALFLTVNTVEEAAFVACVFWVAGYVLYGLLCAVSKRKSTAPAQAAAAAAPPPVITLPVQVKPAAEPPVKPNPRQPSTPANVISRSNVRLDHAIAVTAKLLEKNLGKTDRQELEKLKNTLEVLKVKGTLTPAEGEILNENFNTLLKLMAKYNV